MTTRKHIDAGYRDRVAIAHDSGKSMTAVGDYLAGDRDQRESTITAIESAMVRLNLRHLIRVRRAAA